MHDWKENDTTWDQDDGRALATNEFQNQIVTLRSFLARAVTKWDVEESKIFMCFLSKISTIDDKGWVTVSKSDLADYLQIDVTNRSHLRERLQRIMEKSYIQCNGPTDDEWEDGFVLTRVRSTKNTLSLKFAEENVDFFKQVSAPYTSTYLEYIKDFQHKSSYNLYMFLLSWSNFNYATHRRKVFKNEIKSVFNLKEGQYWRNYGKENAKFDWKSFERFVLDPAVEEIQASESCDMRFGRDPETGKLYKKIRDERNKKTIYGYEFEFMFVDKNGYLKWTPKKD